MNDWQLYALASAFFAGLTAIFSKVGVTGISSNLATFIRTVTIILFLIIFLTIRREWSAFSTSGRSLFFLILSGLTTGFSWLCYFRALQTGPASGVAPLDKLSLVFAVVLAVLFLGEQLNGIKWLGVILMGSGALLIAIQ